MWPSCVAAHGESLIAGISAVYLQWSVKFSYIGFEMWLIVGNGTENKQLGSVQSFSHVQLFATPWIAARQASLFITNSWSLLKLMSNESVMPSNRLVLCHPLLLLPSIFPSIRVFFKDSVLCIRWPKYWSFSVSPSNEHLGLISFRMDWLLQIRVHIATTKTWHSQTN